MGGKLQPVRDQDPGPEADQCLKSRGGAACFDGEKGHGGVDHHQELGQHAVLRARGFVHGIAPCASRPIADLLIRGRNGLRHAIHTLLNDPNAHGEAKPGWAKGLHSLARAALSPAQFLDKSRETRAVSGGIAFRHQGFDGDTAGGTFSPMTRKESSCRRQESRPRPFLHIKWYP